MIPPGGRSRPVDPWGAVPTSPPLLLAQQPTSHASTAPSSLSEDRGGEEAHQEPRVLPGVDKRRQALLRAVAWAEGRGDPGDTEPQAPPHLPALHLLLSCVKHHRGWAGSHGARATGDWTAEGATGAACAGSSGVTPAFGAPAAMWRAP